MEACLKQIKLNGIGNILSLLVVIYSLSIKNWAVVEGIEFSLRAVNMNNMGGWVDTQRFKHMCTKYNMQQYSDIKDDCEVISSFEMGGILVIIIQLILFAVFGLSIQSYNILSAFSTYYKLNIEVIELQFPHFISPVAYSVALLLYLTSIFSAFNIYKPQFAFWLFTANVIFNYCLCFHYSLHKFKLNSND